MGRMRRGWELTKKSWALLRSDRTLLVFPLIALPASLVVGAVLFAPGVAIYAGSHSEPALIAFGVVAGYGLTFVALFFNVALAACATRALDGEPASIGDGIAAARGRVGVIAQWAAVQLTIGILLSALQQLGGESGVGRLVSALLAGALNLAWNIATFFVVPVIALEGLAPKAAFKRSASVIRERWGEGLVGSGAIGGLVLLIALLPVGGLVLGGVALARGHAAGPESFALWGLAAALLLAAVFVAGVLGAVFRVVLFRYATDGQALAGFGEDELAGAFRPKRLSRGR